jgi:hypothetical protein
VVVTAAADGMVVVVVVEWYSNVLTLLVQV